MKVQSVTFESKAKLINSGSAGGFGELKYLTNLTTTSRTDRHKQQGEFMRYVREVGCQSIFIAMLRGECLIYSDKDSDISSMASQEIRIVVRGLLELKSKWQTLNHTHIHREAEDLSKDYSNIVVLDAPVALLIDSFLKRAILKFLPPSFVTRMKLVNKDFEADRLSAAGTIALVFGDDKSEKAMTAKADRADCEKALHVKLEKGTSPKWGLARSRLRGFWSGFVLTGVSPASCSKRPDVAVRSARHEASGSVYFIKLSAGLGSCFPQLFGENKAR
jgi:hypothetical protein